MLVVAGLLGAASLAAACGDSTTAPIAVVPPFDSLAQANISGTLKLFGGGGQWAIDLTAVVHNTTNRSRTFPVHPGCPVALFVYNNFAGSGADVWNTVAQNPGCTNTVTTDTIAPGDSLVLLTHTSTNEILAHYGTPPANPPGQYYFYWVLTTDLAPSGSMRGLAGFSQLGP